MAEEARVEGEYHVPTLQLLKYTEGDAAGSVSIRFCHYSHTGRFSRSPLMVAEPDILGLRQALEDTPRIRELLEQLVG